MSSGNDFHLHFISQNQSYDVDFQQQEKASAENVMIDGRNYVIRGDKSEVLWLKAKLPELAKSGMTIEDLKIRLQDVGAKEIGIAERVQSVAIQPFGQQVAHKEGAWSLQKKASLPGKQKLVANKYWEKNSSRFAKIAKTTKHIERLKKQMESTSRGKAGRAKRSSLTTQIDIHEKRLADLRKPDGMFLQFLKNCSNNPGIVEKTFLAAVEGNDPAKFQKLFAKSTEEQLSAIDHGEGLNVIPRAPLSQKPVTVTKSDLKDIQDYMRDTGFSGAVTITDRSSTYTVSTPNVPDPQAPFAIHSVGKVFTGVLALRMIEEKVIPKKALDKPIQLSAEIVEKLPPKVREQLKHTTLREVMLHHGRYGDYLGNYQDAIEAALQENRLPPVVDAPEDFLQFADKNLVVPDKSGYAYSNLGLLLVGLSLQHLYNSQNKEAMTYDGLLHDYVLEPAGVGVYERHKPEKARVNPQDKVSSHITGGPAGGAWSTVGDLARFGNWLGAKYRDTDSPFSDLIEEFGGEFFSEREFSHGGSIESASAHLSHRLENGVTITIVSDKEGLGLASDLAQTIQENLLKQTPLERSTHELGARLSETGDLAGEPLLKSKL